jgi:hypothetical protein
MTDNVTRLPFGVNAPRRAFIEAWQTWVRDTAKQLVEATEFEEVTAILAELRLAYRVMELIVGEHDEETDQ